MKVIDSIVEVTSRYTQSERAKTDLGKYKEILDSNISRIEKWVKEKDIAVLTAFRGYLDNVVSKDRTLIDKPLEGPIEERKYTKAENRARNRNLKAALLEQGYGVTSVTGVYPEETPDGKAVKKREESLMVVNLNNDPEFQSKIARLSEWYNQDSYLYKPQGQEDAVLIGTNSAWPGYGENVTAGKFMRAVEGPFITKLKNRGFAFTEDPQEYNETDTETWQDRKDQRVLHKVDDEFIRDSFVEQRVNSQGMGMCIHSIVNSACKLGLLPNL